MKNSKLVKISLVVIMSIAMLVFMIGNVFAENYQDLTTAVNGTNSATTGNNTTGNNTTGNNTARNNTARNNTATSALNSANATNRTNTANNTSTYNNTTLPHTGIGDSIPVAVLVVVFGISAVYAYKKIKEYKNI